MYESVEGLGISLYDIGIQSSTNYKEAGKLVINEGKLEKALKERPSEVVELLQSNQKLRIVMPLKEVKENRKMVLLIEFMIFYKTIFVLQETTTIIEGR